MAKDIQRLKDQGKCIRCRHEDAVKGRTMCEACLARQREISNAKYHELRSQHLCVACGVRVENGETRCQKCKQDMRNYIKAIYKKHLENGLCGRCGRKMTPGYKTCTECRMAAAQTYFEKKERRKMERECCKPPVAL